MSYLLPKREQIERDLLEAMEIAHARYQADKSKQGEYLRALNTFSDFIISGYLPEHTEDPGDAAPQHARQRAAR